MTERTQRYPGFPDGINNVARSDDVPPTAAERLINVDILGRSGRVQRRQGYTKLYTGTDLHSLHATGAYLLGVEGTTLKRWVEVDGVPLTLETGLRGAVSYVVYDGMVIWSCANKIGWVNGQGQPRQFGVRAPSGNPTLSASSTGGWNAGTVMVTLTYATADGLESGAPPAAYITLSEGQGVRLSNIPQSADADQINIYATEPDGETLYFRGAIPTGTTAFTLNYARGRRALSTQDLDKLPAGDALAEHNGIVFSAAGRTVYFSTPFRPWAYHTTHGFFQEASNVTLLLSGDSGVFVGCSEGVFAYTGEEPGRMRRTWVSEPAIPGAALSIDGGHINPQYQGRTVALWWTTQGSMIIGLPDGSAEVVRDMEFRIPEAEQGAMAEVTRNGVKQIVSLMRNPKPDSVLAFEDDLSVEVHRNGV